MINYFTVVALALLSTIMLAALYTRLLLRARSKNWLKLFYYVIFVLFGIFLQLFIMGVALNQIDPALPLKDRIHARVVALIVGLFVYCMPLYFCAYYIHARYGKNERESKQKGTGTE